MTPQQIEEEARGRSRPVDGAWLNEMGQARGGHVSFRANSAERKDGGRLTAADRRGLPSSDFALPGHGEGPKGKGSGSYPIPDESHARNALARVSQHGSPAEQRTVRAAVHRKFPDIGER